MRIIKFRAWDKSFEEMNYSGNFGAGSSADLITISFNGSINVQNAYGLDFGQRNPAFDPPVDNFELMQFTGLTDKNGKEVYEGDIVSTKHQPLAKVVWHSEFTTFCTEEIDEISGIYQFTIKPSETEIIGNIYENPELLTT